MDVNPQVNNQGEQRRRWRVSLPLVDSNIRASFFYFWHNDAFSYIIFGLYLINKWSVVVQWQARCSMTHRTWVRIPGPPKCFIFFLFRWSSDDSIAQHIIHPHSNACQMAPGQIWWSKGDAHHTPKSTGTRRIKSQPGLQHYWATNLPSKPPNWA